MNMSNVCARLGELSGLDGAELQRVLPLADAARAVVESRCIVDSPDEGQTQRLELLCAAYALKLYETCHGDITRFQAGDVAFTASSVGGGALWSELCAANADLIAPEGFIFGAVQS